jgi:hypothetical protein
MRRLVDVVQYRAEPSNQSALIYGLFGNTALVHVTTFVSELTRRGSIVELMLTWIRESLKVVNLLTFQIASPAVDMMWIDFFVPIVFFRQ